jgi:hypothetical protein
MKMFQLTFAVVIVTVWCAAAYIGAKEVDANARVKIACIEHGGTWNKPSWLSGPVCIGSRGKP